MGGVDAEAALATLRSDGVVLAERMVPEGRLAALEREFDLLFDPCVDGVRVGVHPPGRMSTIDAAITPRTFFPEIFAIFFNPDLMRIAHNYLPVGAKIHEKIIATHEQRPGPITETHFDMLRTLKFMVYLTDTDERNGAFRYARGTHLDNAALRKEFVARGGYLNALPNIAALSEKVELSSIPAPAGSLIVFDTEGFHAGGVISPGAQRKVLRSSSYFPNRDAVAPIRLSPDWFRARFGFPRRPPIELAGRRSTGGSAR